MWKYEQEFRIDKPETVGETDRHFDLYNYKDWLEGQLTDCRKQLSIHVVGRSELLIDFFKWLNTYEELQYTEKGIRFYVGEYLKSINSR